MWEPKALITIVKSFMRLGPAYMISFFTLACAIPRATHACVDCVEL